MNSILFTGSNPTKRWSLIWSMTLSDYILWHIFLDRNQDSYFAGHCRMGSKSTSELPKNIAGSNPVKRMKNRIPCARLWLLLFADDRFTSLHPNTTLSMEYSTDEPRCILPQSEQFLVHPQQLVRLLKLHVLKSGYVSHLDFRIMQGYRGEWQASI